MPMHGGSTELRRRAERSAISAGDGLRSRDGLGIVDVFNLVNDWTW